MEKYDESKDVWSQLCKDLEAERTRNAELEQANAALQAEYDALRERTRGLEELDSDQIMSELDTHINEVICSERDYTKTGNIGDGDCVVLAANNIRDLMQRVLNAFAAPAPEGVVAPKCAICGKPAACFGKYAEVPEGYACDECCGHGCEDGHCEPIEQPAGSAEAVTKGQDNEN